MESIVEDVEDETEEEGKPAYCKYREKSGWFEFMRSSFGVNHSDRLSICRV